MIYIVTVEQKVVRKFAIEADSSSEAVSVAERGYEDLDCMTDTTIEPEANKVEGPFDDDNILEIMAAEMGITEEDEYYTDEVLDSFINIKDEE